MHSSKHFSINDRKRIKRISQHTKQNLDSREDLESSEWSRQSSGHGSARGIPVPRGHVASPLRGASHAYILQQPGTSSKKRVGTLVGRYKRGPGTKKGGKMEPLTGGKKRNK